jgi:putative Ca2+/H+ antiporter (TMEM165/GDT1 family)
MSSLLTIFLSVFFAELGDKTQLASIMFASDKNNSPYLVFFAASAALVVSTAIAVLLGTAAEKWLTFFPLKLIAGIGFVAIGLWTIYGHFATGN